MKTMSVTALPYAENVRARVTFLSAMYNHAKGHTGLVHVEKVESKNGIYKVLMRTRGLPFQPVAEKHLNRMMRCVLTGLARLHEKGFVHRDIRNTNILYLPTAPPNARYALIDFEHGERSGKKPDEWLRDWDEDTLHDGKYDTFSDLYQLGKLLGMYSGMLSEPGRRLVASLRGRATSARELLASNQWIRLAM